MKVSVAYGLAKRQAWLTVEVPEGASIRDAILQSGILAQFPEIDLDHQKVGIFGKVVSLEARLEDGDRVEIYRPLVADPKTLKSRGKGGDAESPAADA